MKDARPAAQDLSSMTDEQLILLVRENDNNQDAWSALIEHWLKWLPRLIASLAHGQLDDDECADAVQIILFKLAQAVRRRFAVSPGDGVDGGKFRTFAGQVAINAVIDTRRKRARHEAHIDRSISVHGEIESRRTGPHSERACAVIMGQDASDPAQVVEKRERLRRLEATIQHVHPKAWSMVRSLRAGQSLPNVAIKLHIGYKTAQRLRAEIREAIRAFITEGGDSP